MNKQFELSKHSFICDDEAYQAKQDHSDLLDEALGFKVIQIEEEILSQAKSVDPDGSVQSWGKRLHDGLQTYVGLNPRQLQTTYDELYRMCDSLSPKAGESFIDLGAGYGRLGLVLDRLSPESKFIGYEYVAERVLEGNRIFEKQNCKNAKLIKEDLFSDEFKLPVAEYYFMYDFGRVDHIRKILDELREISLKHPIKVVARGRGCRSLIDYSHPWLSQVFKPILTETYAIYSTCGDLVD